MNSRHNVTVLNLHGYQGNSKNTNFQILSDAGFNVVSPQFDYDNELLSDILDQLSTLVRSNHVDLIVATSFGTFVGKHLSIVTGIPIIATNPCLNPYESLRRISSTYFDNEANKESVIKWHEAHLGTYGNDVFIIGDSDEVIDHSITFDEACSSTFFVVPGGHRLQRDDYAELLIDQIERKQF